MSTSTGLWSIKVMLGMDRLRLFYRAPVCGPCVCDATGPAGWRGAVPAAWHTVRCRWPHGKDGPDQPYEPVCSRSAQDSSLGEDATAWSSGHPERVARFQLAPASRFTSQHTRSPISGHTAVASGNGALTQLGSPPVASNLTANRHRVRLRPAVIPAGLIPRLDCV